jgi:hypothetical protein
MAKTAWPKEHSKIRFTIRVRPRHRKTRHPSCSGCDFLSKKLQSGRNALGFAETRGKALHFVVGIKKRLPLM